MGKRKYKEKAKKLYENLIEMSTNAKKSAGKSLISDGSFSTDDLLVATESPGTIEALEAQTRATREQPKMGKFRFQLLSAWISAHFQPCRVADIGGGKGLLAYLLQKEGWKATVVDPVYQPLPDKYKDLVTHTRVRIEPTESVPHSNKAFEPNMARDFDLLIGLHAHGCNVKIIDAAAEYGRSFVLFPCCIIDEPLYPPHGTHWLQCLVDYAIRKGFDVHPFRLNFSGQNIGICAWAKAVQPGTIIQGSSKNDG